MSPTEPTLEQLVSGCVKNDRKCQELMYRKYFATMLRTCMRYTSDKELALQLVNDGFLRVFQKIEMYHHTGSLEGWIRRIVFHAVADHFRSKKEKVHFIELEDYIHPAVEQQQHDHLLLDELMLLVQKLPDASRHVFVKFAMEGLSHQEIADELTISVGTSKWHVSHARQVLQDALRKRGLDLPTYLESRL
jgi:RNA polymerase sigma factor (sigma-70 family)